MIQQNGKHIEQIMREFNAFKSRITTIVGTEAVNFFAYSFTRQGFINESGVEKWKPRKRMAKRNRGRGILIDTGRLKRSIRIVSKSINMVTVGTDVPYAKAHNEGITIDKTVQVKSFARRVKSKYQRSSLKTRKTSIKRQHLGETTQVKAHSRHMKIKLDKRQFMGNSAFLNKRLNLILSRELKNIIE